MKALGHACLYLVLATAALVSARDGPKSKPSDKCDSILLKYSKQYHSHMGDSINNRNLLEFDVAAGLLMTSDGYVTAEVFAATDDLGALLPLLASFDWVTVNGCYGRQCSARFHISQLEALTSYPEVVFVEANIISSNRAFRDGSAETLATTTSTTSHSVFANGARALQSGSVDSFASQSMFADQARETFGVNGTGVKICVLSDSFDFDFRRITSASDDIASGDLPSFADMDIVRDLRPSDGAFGSDEGRAMMQLIHDVAPGATLGFHTAILGAAAFANAIITLIGRECDLIVDDVVYFTAPMYQDGVIAQAATSATNVGVPFFSAASNVARNAWEAPYVATTLIRFGDRSFHDFGTAATDKPTPEPTPNPTPAPTHEPTSTPTDGPTLSPTTLAPTGTPTVSPTTIRPTSSPTDSPTSQPTSAPTDGYFKVFITQGTAIALHWSDPYSTVPGSRFGPLTDLDLFLFQSGTFALVAASTQGNSETPVEVLFVGATGEYDIYIENFAGPDPDFVKLTFFGEVVVIDGPRLEASTSFGHPNAAGVVGVGAADMFDTPGFGRSPAIPEVFTAAGGVPILFGRDGDRLNQPEVREAPLVVGPDGTCTTFFGRFFQGSGGECPFRFFGTSAAAPNVASVAALMLEADPLLEPSDISRILAQTSEDMDDTFTAQFSVGFDVLTGYGFVNALNAVTSAVQTTPPSSAPSQSSLPTIVGSTQQPMPSDMPSMVATLSPPMGKGMMKGAGKGMMKETGKGMMKETGKGMVKEKSKGTVKEKSKGTRNNSKGMDRYGGNGTKGNSIRERNLGGRKLVRGLKADEEERLASTTTSDPAHPRDLSFRYSSNLVGLILSPSLDNL